MGIGWTFGFVASFSNNLILWWIFDIITSTHGFVIFISLCSGKQVRETLKSCLKRKKPGPGLGPGVNLSVRNRDSRSYEEQRETRLSSSDSLG